ncbi:hypothetical protein PC129_g25183 [Phytophthora cactorum]|uniref:Uncharacterized protein n=1 Tax=Phytophthora cactorum TaxID=29920 RepID=A0A8T1KDQ9_9STRA|nr:hypothetical protein PC117_g14215 [Phytophthora cactorum]KAG2959886.1 hypothetical protein PC119_g26574 [Phytophthora cactorum]KAG3149012.1 hypothetical protein PC128_g23480 [Phytophthora cactorum]KAG3188837.1 hypothetical protein PC129_g25183 [Phytophthora cactorum]KAG4036107.1 hypothetical protein PC123_g28325 [Phytophthora cactorum]
MKHPRKEISSAPKTHLSKLPFNLLVRMHSSIARKCSTWLSTSDFPCSARLWTKTPSKHVCAYARWGLNNCVTRRLNVAGAFDSPLGHHQPLPEHPARSAHRCKRYVTRSHEQLVVTID